MFFFAVLSHRIVRHTNHSHLRQDRRCRLHLTPDTTLPRRNPPIVRRLCICRGLCQFFERWSVLQSRVVLPHIPIYHIRPRLFYDIDGCAGVHTFERLKDRLCDEKRAFYANILEVSEQRIVGCLYRVTPVKGRRVPDSQKPRPHVGCVRVSDVDVHVSERSHDAHLSLIVLSPSIENEDGMPVRTVAFVRCRLVSR